MRPTILKAFACSLPICILLASAAQADDLRTEGIAKTHGMKFNSEGWLLSVDGAAGAAKANSNPTKNASFSGSFDLKTPWALMTDDFVGIPKDEIRLLEIEPRLKVNADVKRGPDNQRREAEAGLINTFHFQVAEKHTDRGHAYNVNAHHLDVTATHQKNNSTKTNLTGARLTLAEVGVEAKIRISDTPVFATLCAAGSASQVFLTPDSKIASEDAGKLAYAFKGKGCAGIAVGELEEGNSEHIEYSVEGGKTFAGNHNSTGNVAHSVTVSSKGNFPFEVTYTHEKENAAAGARELTVHRNLFLVGSGF